MKVVFLISGPDISGGMNVILNHASYLAHNGVECTIASLRVVDKSVFKWHDRAYSEIDSGKLLLKTITQCADQEYDFAIGTYWLTIFDLWRVNAKSYLYFVQSIESRFPDSNDILTKVLIEGTYSLGLGKIVIADWIQKYLKDVHHVPSSVVKNGIDKNIFKLDGQVIQSDSTNSDLKILIEGSVHAQFKNVKETIESCIEADCGEIWLLTPTKITSYPGVDRIFSQVPISEVHKIYRSCDILVKLSFVEGMFGPPLEMFHCGGTAICYEVTGASEYMVSHENSILVPRGRKDLVTNWIKVLNFRRDLLSKLKQNATNTALNWPDWDNSSNLFLSDLKERLNMETVSRELLRSASHNLMALYKIAISQSEIQKNIEGKNHIYSELNQEIEYLKSVVDSYRNSTSWKIGHPLRKIKDAFKRIV